MIRLKQIVEVIYLKKVLKVSRNLHSFLLEKLSARIPDAEHRVLLKKVLEWYMDNGSKFLKVKLEDQISSILQGWDENAE